MALHAATIEFIWVAVSLVGLIVNSLMFRSALSVQTILRVDESATAPELIIASASVRQEAVRVGKQMILFVGGSMSVFLAPPPPSIYEIPQTVVGVGSVVGVSLMMTIASLIERRAQRLVMLSVTRRPPYERDNGDIVTKGTRLTDRMG